MTERRQRARVQGGWAGAPAGRLAAPKAPVASNLAPAGTRSAWMREGQPNTQKQFVFEKPSEVERKVPEAGVIDKPGVYVLSKVPTGISRIHLIPGFIDSKQADWMFEQLLQDIPWGQRTRIRQEVSFEEPRLTSWYGELPYTYSRITMQPNPNWHPLLTMLKERIEEFTGYTFNSLLCNLYRNEKDSVDWHSDDEPSLGKNPVIASLSFGATRTFEMRKKPSPEENGDYTYVERLRIPLDHGTLLMMEGATQEDWQHRVPKEYHSRDARINLTFRIIYPEHDGVWKWRGTLGIVEYKLTADPEPQIATDLKEALREQSSVKYLMEKRINVVMIFDNQKLPVLCGQCCFVFRNDTLVDDTKSQALSLWKNNDLSYKNTKHMKDLRGTD